MLFNPGDLVILKWDDYEELWASPPSGRDHIGPSAGSVKNGDVCVVLATVKDPETAPFSMMLLHGCGIGWTTATWRFVVVTHATWLTVARQGG